MESGRARAGITVAERLRRKRKITSTTSDSDSQRVNLTSSTDSSIDCERSKRMLSLTDAGSWLSKRGSSSRTASATSHGVGARLALHGEHHRALVVEPGGGLVVLRRCRARGRAPAAAPASRSVGHHQRAVVGGGGELPLRLDGEGALVAVERAGGQVDVGVADGGAHLVDADAARGQRVGVELDAHGVLLAAEHLHLRHAGHRRDALRHHRLRVLVELRQRQRGRGQGEVEDRRVAPG